MNNVELAFKDRGIPRVGTYVYLKSVAIEFIKACRENDTNILGIDALLIQGNFTRPSMENSIDFTASPYRQNPPKNIWDAAITFLNERDDIYYFEIVCEK
jgi:hypothetical protein